MYLSIYLRAPPSPPPPIFLQDFHRRVVPKAGLDKVIVRGDLTDSLQEIIQFEKARYMQT